MIPDAHSWKVNTKYPHFVMIVGQNTLPTTTIFNRSNVQLTLGKYKYQDL